MSKVKYRVREYNPTSAQQGSHSFFDIEDKTTAYMMYPTHKR
jgi:hypothetical protein